jgi:hypothetical protein
MLGRRDREQTAFTNFPMSEYSVIVEIRTIFPFKSIISKNQHSKSLATHASLLVEGTNYVYMATDNQIEANRLNARHCTGPKTEDGKTRSSQNALKTGLYSKAEVTATESREEYEALAADYYHHFIPATPHERSLVDALVRYEWLSRRYMAADTALWNFSLVDNKTPQGKAFMYHAENLSRAGRYFNSARKGYATTLKEVEAAQSKRKAEDNAQQETAPKPEQNQSAAPKLVSFRQPQFTSEPPKRQIDQQPENHPEAPPKAA